MSPEMSMDVHHSRGGGIAGGCQYTEGFGEPRAPRCAGQRFHQRRLSVLCAGQMVFDSCEGCGVVFVRTYCECSSGRSGRVKVCCQSFGHGRRPSAPKNQTYRRCQRVRVGNKTRARQTHLEQVKFWGCRLMPPTLEAGVGRHLHNSATIS